jgi:hypothetical protein
MGCTVGVDVTGGVDVVGVDVVGDEVGVDVVGGVLELEAGGGSSFLAQPARTSASETATSGKRRIGRAAPEGG